MALKKLNLYEFGNSTRTLWVQQPTTSVFINAEAVYATSCQESQKTNMPFHERRALTRTLII